MKVTIHNSSKRYIILTSLCLTSYQFAHRIKEQILTQSQSIPGFHLNLDKTFIIMKTILERMIILMTNRERILRAFRGQATDRVIAAPFIWYNFVAEFYGTEDLDYIEKGIEVYKHFNLDCVFRMCTVLDILDEKFLDSKNWRVDVKTIKASEESWSEITTVRTPEHELRQVKDFRRISPYQSVAATSECFIKDEEDFDQFVKYQPPLLESDLTKIRHAREVMGDQGVTCPWSNGAFNLLANYRKLDDLLMDPYINPELYEKMCSYFPDRFAGFFAQLKKAGADMVVCDGNQATGTTAGPGFFTKYVLDMEKRYARKAKDAGLIYMYHNCGDASSILNCYNEVGMDVYESMTPPPYGDTLLEDALKIVNRNIVLSGNIDQIEFLRKATPLQVREQVRKVLDLGKRRGNFVLGTSDYLNENTPYENIFALSEACYEFGRY